MLLPHHCVTVWNTFLLSEYFNNQTKSQEGVLWWPRNGRNSIKNIHLFRVTSAEGEVWLKKKKKKSPLAKLRPHALEPYLAFNVSHQLKEKAAGRQTTAVEGLNTLPLVHSQPSPPTPPSEETCHHLVTSQPWVTVRTRGGAIGTHALVISATTSSPPTHFISLQFNTTSTRPSRHTGESSGIY